MADPIQIHQVIMNLCTNAGHAMTEAGGTLFVDLTETANWVSAPGAVQDRNDNPVLLLTIRDTGKGIPKDIIDRIFDPFFTTKERGQGTGMGLSVVHGIISSCGGHIRVESSEGIGTEFIVELPILLEAQKETLETKAILSLGTERILFVDDEPFQIDLGGKMLGRLGYSVTTKNDSTKALALFRSNPNAFDLVITDLTMPKLTGDRMAREMLALRPGLPIILCTGYSERFTEEDARSIGIQGFAHKPLVIKDLAELTRRVLDENQCRPEHRERESD